MTYYNRRDVKRVDLILTGGGALGAEQAGMIAHSLLDPKLEIRAISGVSAGLLNGATIKQVIGQHGWTPNGRQILAETLQKKWTKSIAVDAFSAATAQNIQTASAILDSSCRMFQNVAALYGANVQSLFNMSLAPTIAMHETAKRQAQIMYSVAFRQLVDSVVSAPDLLQDDRGIVLCGEAVNQRTQKGKIFSQITKEVIIASASLPGIFDPVMIDGEPYRDGACQGGSNSALEPLLELGDDDIDARLCYSTNPPYSEYRDVDPRQLRAKDLEETDSLILTQGLWPLMKEVQKYEQGETSVPTQIIWRSSGEILSKKAKLNPSQSALTHSFNTGARDIKSIIERHHDSLFKRPIHSFDELTMIAKRNAQRLGHGKLVAA